jgi:hypothetical protein
VGVGSGGIGGALGGGLRAMHAGAGRGSGGVGGVLRGGSGLGMGGLREKVLGIARHLVGARVGIPLCNESTVHMHMCHEHVWHMTT